MEKANSNKKKRIWPKILIFAIAEVIVLVGIFAYAYFLKQYNKIQRIIVNLIGNAFKYSPSGTKIEIVAEIKNQELSISIIDEGCGIKEEEIDNIFKRLYRVEASRNMKTGGYGLGLAIAKQLALQINGDILVESEYGKGSKFTLKINC